MSKKKIDELSATRLVLQKELETVEVQLYKLEGSYLQSCAEIGTVLDGWCNYQRTSKKKRVYTDHDRVFTLSSATGIATAEKYGLVSAPTRRRLGVVAEQASPPS